GHTVAVEVDEVPERLLHLAAVAWGRRVIVLCDLGGPPDPLGRLIPGSRRKLLEPAVGGASGWIEPAAGTKRATRHGARRGAECKRTVAVQTREVEQSIAIEISRIRGKLLLLRHLGEACQDDRVVVEASKPGIVVKLWAHQEISEAIVVEIAEPPVED